MKVKTGNFTSYMHNSQDFKPWLKLLSSKQSWQLSSSLLCWVKRSHCHRLLNYSKAPALRLSKEMRVYKTEVNGPATRPCTCPRALFTRTFSSWDMYSTNWGGGITQNRFLPKCQKPNFEAWSSFYLNSKLPFEDVVVIFNQIAKAIHSNTHETFKSDFLP